MSPDNIMRSDVLDIIFENRNKDYGAYSLRKNYSKRLKVSLSVVLLITFVLLLVNQLKPEPIRTSEINISDTDPIKLLEEEKPKPKEPVAPKPQQQQVATVQYTIPIITDEVTEDTMPIMAAVENAVVGTENKQGD